MQSDKSGQIDRVWRKSLARHIKGPRMFFPFFPQTHTKKLEYRNEKYQFLWLNLFMTWRNSSKIKQNPGSVGVNIYLFTPPTKSGSSHQWTTSSVSITVFCLGFFFAKLKQYIFSYFWQHYCDFYVFPIKCRSLSRMAVIFFSLITCQKKKNNSELRLQFLLWAQCGVEKSRPPPPQHPVISGHLISRVNVVSLARACWRLSEGITWPLTDTLAENCRSHYRQVLHRVQTLPPPPSSAVSWTREQNFNIVIGLE